MPRSTLADRPSSASPAGEAAALDALRRMDRAWLGFASLVVLCATVVAVVELVTRPEHPAPSLTLYQPKEREPITFGDVPWRWHVGLLSRPGTAILYWGDRSWRFEAEGER